MRRTSSRDYSKYTSQQLLCFFHPGSDIASSVNLFLRWPAPLILVLGRLAKWSKTAHKVETQTIHTFVKNSLLFPTSLFRTAKSAAWFWASAST